MKDGLIKGAMAAALVVGGYWVAAQDNSTGRLITICVFAFFGSYMGARTSQRRRRERMEKALRPLVEKLREGPMNQEPERVADRLEQILESR